MCMEKKKKEVKGKEEREIEKKRGLKINVVGASANDLQPPSFFRIARLSSFEDIQTPPFFLSALPGHALLTQIRTQLFRLAQNRPELTKQAYCNGGECSQSDTV